MPTLAANHAKPFGRVLFAAALAVAILALSAALASALVSKGGINRQVARSGNGRVVHARGTFRCGPTPGQFVRLRITISQQSTGAVAEGNWKHKCTGKMRWSLRMRTSTVPFAAGAGQGTGRAIVNFTSSGRVFFAWQWLNKLTLQ